METIRETVERYHGMYGFWEEGNRLIQRITLKQNRDGERIRS